jgi:predicted RNA binding protein YcfA (HicA-like mRNA interferase family)
LKSLGYAFARQGAGSHEVWSHTVTGLVIIVPHHGRDMPEGTLRAILRETQIDVDDFLRA